MSFLSFDEFPDLQPIVDEYESIVAEVPDSDKWMSWVSDAQDPSGHCAFLDGDWTVFPAYLRPGRSWREEMVVPDDADERVVAALDRFFDTLPQRFPATYRLIDSAKRIRYAGFSRLHPKSRIDLHSHEDMGVHNMQIGIRVPEGGRAGLEVDGEVQIWSRPGDSLIFDDTAPHRAWNDSDEDRIVLILAVEKDEA